MQGVKINRLCCMRSFRVIYDRLYGSMSSFFPPLIADFVPVSARGSTYLSKLSDDASRRYRPTLLHELPSYPVRSSSVLDLELLPSAYGSCVPVCVWELRPRAACSLSDFELSPGSLPHESLSYVHIRQATHRGSMSPRFETSAKDGISLRNRAEICKRRLSRSYSQLEVRPWNYAETVTGLASTQVREDAILKGIRTSILRALLVSPTNQGTRMYL